jgi:hypothetical protein
VVRVRVTGSRGSVLHPYGVAHLSSGERVKKNAKKVPKKVHSHLALALCKSGENRLDLEPV